MSNYCGFFNCDCDEVTEELQEEYGEHCLIDCEECKWKEEQ